MSISSCFSYMMEHPKLLKELLKINHMENEIEVVKKIIQIFPQI
jgi:hypothetical protein